MTPPTFMMEDEYYDLLYTVFLMNNTECRDVAFVDNYTCILIHLFSHYQYDEAPVNIEGVADDMFSTLSFIIDYLYCKMNMRMLGREFHYKDYMRFVYLGDNHVEKLVNISLFSSFYFSKMTAVHF
jgi:hypothetical protein